MQKTPTTNIAVVVTTLNRPKSLLQTLQSLSEQSCPATEVAVVGATGARLPNDIFREISRLGYRYEEAEVANQMTQRQLGLDLMIPRYQWIAVVDDDLILDRSYFAEIAKFIAHIGWQPAGLCGQISSEQSKGKLSKGLGAGERNGFKYISNLSAYGRPLRLDLRDEPVLTDWIPTAGSVWHREILLTVRHTPLYGRFRMYEDVLFCDSVRQRYPIFVVPKSKATEIRVESELDVRVRYEKSRTYSLNSAFLVAQCPLYLRIIHIMWIAYLALQRLRWAMVSESRARVAEACGFFSSLPTLIFYQIHLTMSAQRDWVLKKSVNQKLLK